MRYLSCAETAKLVRQALKESFPGVKFSVRSSTYSGGASIDVRWTDGPTGKAVDEILGAFEGSYFDGMIDYKGSRTHKLDGELVRLGADFIHGNRRVGRELAERILAKLNGKAWNAKLCGGECFGYHFEGTEPCRLNVPPYAIAEAEAELEDQVQAQRSKTLARIAFYGDDGYGAGTVGDPDGDGGDQAYKAMSERQDRTEPDAAPVVQDPIDELVPVALTPVAALRAIKEALGQAETFPADVAFARKVCNASLELAIKKLDAKPAAPPVLFLVPGGRA